MASYSYPDQTTSSGEGAIKGAITGSQYGGMAGAIAGGIYGWASQKKRNKAQKAAQDRLTETLNNRPKYQRQAEFDENVKQAKGVQAIYDPLTKTNQLPGQAYMQNRVDNNASNALAKAGMEGLTSPSQYAQLLAATTQSQNDATTNLGIAGAQNRQDNIANYANATQNVQNANTALAREKDVEWDTNVQQPWLASTNMARDTFNDAVGRNRQKSDQESAAAMNSLNYQRDFATSMIPMVASGGASGVGAKGTAGVTKSSGVGVGQSYSPGAAAWNNGRYTR